MTRIVATLDPATAGAALELRDGGMIVTYDTGGTPLSRNARATQGVSTGRHYWECIVYGDGTTAIAADTAAVGVITAATTASAWPGNVPTTAGYRPGDGGCWQNGSLVATVAATPLRSVIGLALDLVAATPTLKVYINRLLVRTFNLPASQVWYPAVSIAGTQAYAFSVFVNFGARAFENSVPADHRAGVFQTEAMFAPMHLASEDWMSPHPLNVAYEGRIRRAGEFVFDQGVAFWVWSTSGSTWSAAELECDNRDGRFDSLVTNPPRDVRLVFKLVDAEAPASAPVQVCTMLLDRATQVDNDTVRLRLRSPLAVFEQPLQTKYFLPFVVDGTSARVWPMTFGACRNVEPVLVDAVARMYVAHDAPLTQIVAVRDRGDRLDPLAAPPDYSISPDQRGVGLQTEAQGKVTMDVSSSGSPMIVGAPDIDVVRGFGNMTTAVSGMPNQWVTVGTFRATAGHNTNSGGCLRTSSIDGLPAVDPSFAWDVRFLDVRTVQQWHVVKKGCYYRLTYKIRNALWPPNARPNQFQGGWYIAGTGTMDTAGTIAGAVNPGEYTLDFRAKCDGTLAWRGAGFIDPHGISAWNPGDGPWWVEIDDVVCLLKSADTPDLLSNFGNFVSSSLPRWEDFGSSVDCVATHSTITTIEYPSPGLGVIELFVAGGSGNVCRVVYTGDGIATATPYRVALSMAESDANARIRILAYHEASENFYTMAEFAGAGGEATFQVGMPCLFVLEAYSVDDKDAVARVSLLRCFNIGAQLAESAANVPLAGIRLADYMSQVIEQRAGLSSAAWVRSDAEALDVVAGYVFGVHVSDATTGAALLRAPLDTFTAGLATDELGRVRVMRLIAPEVAPDFAVVLDISPVNADGPPVITPDDAPGLTTRAGARRNWTLHGDADFVTDFDPVTGIDAATRTRFKRASQFVVASGLPLAGMYAHARDAGPIDWLHDMPEHAQAEIDRVAALYGVPRAFYAVRVRFDGAPPSVRPGSIVRITWPRWGLQTGKKMLVKNARIAPLGRYVEITAWG